MKSAEPGPTRANPRNHSTTDRTIKQTVILTIVVSTLWLAPQTYAVEGGAGHYISGQYADFSGMPPTQSGFYLGNYFLDYHNGTFSGNRQLPLGGVFAAGVTANLQAEVPLVIYAYPFNFHDITFSSGIAVPFVWTDVKVSATFDRNGNQISGARRQSVSGLGDIQLMPIMAGWTNGDFKLGGLFNVWAPSGDFDTGQLANQGLGYWTFEPMLAFSWISSKIGTEFSVFSGVDFNTRNNTTDYQSGDIFHVDATLAQHLPLFGGIAGAGASAFYLKQISGDSGSGARLGSFEAESYGVGPTLSYVHKIGKSDLIVDGSWLPQLHSVNTPKGNYWWFKLTLTF
jgi:hypothetical protein